MVAITADSWTLLSTVPSVFNIQNTISSDIIICFAAVQPGPTDMMQPGDHFVLHKHAKGTHRGGDPDQLTVNGLGPAGLSAFVRGRREVNGQVSATTRTLSSGETFTVVHNGDPVIHNGDQVVITI